MEGELLRRVEGALSGTIYEQLRALLREVREGMELLSQTSAGQANMLTASHARFVTRLDSLGASIETLAEMTTDIGARIETIEHALQRTRLPLEARSA